MTGFNQVLIGGYSSGGLTTDKKPLMLANEAFSKLENAYVFRDRTKKREGTVGAGRLRRFFSNASLGNSGASVWKIDTIYSTLTGQSYFPITPEPNAEIAEGTVIISIGTTVLRDNGNGTLSQTGVISGATNATNCEITSSSHGLTTNDQISISGVLGMTQLNGNTYTITVVDVNHFTIGINSTSFGVYSGDGTWISLSTFGTINYLSGIVFITYTRTITAVTISFGYYPSLQVMGICRQDVATIGIEQTIFFDTKYAYQYVSGGFQELQPGETWTAPNNVNGTNTFFFWSCNYQGTDSSKRLFFATNNNITFTAATPYDPIRYYDTSWHDLQPLLTATTTLFQALIVIPYYGRLLALNTWEGSTSAGVAGATNFFARCDFSKIGDPTAADSWRYDEFGKGGFLDAPTNESIIGAAFFRNTLIVFFEYSTWQLRYLGEYGLPFIFERVSSDFGSVSTFSSIVFDQGIMTVSNRGIIQAAANGVTRLDEQIPETAFSFEIQNNAPDFVHGIRDFEKEIVYWNYVDVSTSQIFQNFPNTTLLFNYKNNTWAQFRDTITAFGVSQFQFGITWDSLTTFWDDSNVSWDNVDDQNYVDYVTAGNQQGYIFIYENQDAASSVPSITNFAPSLAITAIDFTKNPNVLTVPNHNLASAEFVYLTGMLWNGTDPGLNNQIYQVYPLSVNTLTLGLWNGIGYTAVNKTSTATYIGGGQLALLPKMNIQGKDFNPYQEAGKGFKISYIDFQMDTNSQYPAIPAVTVQLFVNSRMNSQANVITGNKEVQNSNQLVGFISGISLTNPCEINSKNHSLKSGQLIYIANIIGTTQLNLANYVITVIDVDTFSLNGIDATGFTPYVSGGIWNTSPTDGQVYLPGTQYAWYRFYSTQYGQYLRVGLTYDDVLMNQLATHQIPMELNAMNLWMREGGRLIN